MSESTSPQRKPAEIAEPDQPKARKEVPLVAVPSDRELMAEEMAELFDDDRVTHIHGSSEPEAD